MHSVILVSLLAGAHGAGVDVNDVRIAVELALEHLPALLETVPEAQRGDRVRQLQDSSTFTPCANTCVFSSDGECDDGG